MSPTVRGVVSGGRRRGWAVMGVLWLIAATAAAGASASPAAQLVDSETQSTRPVQLTPAEQDFLRAHPVITLGTGDSWDPYVIIGQDGAVTGYDADVLDRIAALTGLRVRLLPGDWRERQEQARSRAIDGLSTGSAHPERAEHLSFSAPYIRLRKYLMVPKGNPLNLRSRDDLDGRTIALHRGNLADEKIASGFSHARILRFDTVDEVIDAVTTGDADATFDNGSLLYRANRMGRPFLQFAFDLNEPLDLVFAVRDDWPEAISIIDKGLLAMGEAERTHLQARWFLSPLNTPTGTDELVLSDEERSFLDRLGPIRLCIDPDWMPFDGLTADGRSQGIMSDLLNLAVERLGRTTQLVPTANWSETLQLARDGRCDIVSAVAITPERAEYLDFTGPLLSEPMIVVVREGVRFNGTLDAHADQRFVMVAGHAGIELLRRAHPALTIETVPDVVTAMRAVSLGYAFGYIDLLPTISYAAREQGILNVKVAGDLPQRYDLAIGVRKDLPLLHSSLSRAVAAMSPQEIRAVRDRWISVRYEQPLDLFRFWPWALALSLAILGILIWNHRLQRLNAALRAANARIERLTITDDLTGLHNRRHFQERLPSEWQRAAREKRTLHLLLADIDHFKQYNDHYGHPAGDEVLRQVGALLIQLTRRAGDLAFRTGGEEFAVMFTEASEGYAERLRVAVEALGIEHVREKGPGSVYSQRQLALPRSVGRWRLILLPRPAPLAQFPVLAGHRFDLPIDAIIADRLVLVECQPQMAKRLVAERDAEQLPIGSTARFLVIAEPEVERVLLQQRVRVAEHIGPVARPAVVSGIRHQACALGIQLDVSVAQQQVGFGLRQRALVAAVPEGTGTLIVVVDGLQVAAADRDEQLRHALGLFRRQQRMDMVGHQHVGVHPTALAHQCLVQPTVGEAN